MAYTYIFAEKMWVATHIFSAKNTCKLDMVLPKTVNILVTNGLIKLMMLWTTGPWYFSYFSMKTYVVGTQKKCLTEALLISTHNVYFQKHNILELCILLCCYD